MSDLTLTATNLQTRLMRSNAYDPLLQAEASEMISTLLDELAANKTEQFATTAVALQSAATSIEQVADGYARNDGALVASALRLEAKAIRESVPAYSMALDVLKEHLTALRIENDARKHTAKVNAATALETLNKVIAAKVDVENKLNWVYENTNITPCACGNLRLPHCVCTFCGGQ